MLDLLKNTLFYVVFTLQHNALWLTIGILVASGIRVYVDPEKLRKVLMKSSKVSIPSTVAFGAFTPFCACGTMAIVVSMLTTVLPWGAIMAFLTSSPLMSPDFFIMLSGIVSVEFAVALLLSSIGIGLSSGFITHHIEKNTSLLHNQARFNSDVSPTADTHAFCCVNGTLTVPLVNKDPYQLKKFMTTIIDIGLKQVLLYFAIFAAVGYWINQFVPTEFQF